MLNQRLLNFKCTKIQPSLHQNIRLFSRIELDNLKFGKQRSSHKFQDEQLNANTAPLWYTFRKYIMGACGVIGGIAVGLTVKSHYRQQRKNRDKLISTYRTIESIEVEKCKDLCNEIISEYIKPRLNAFCDDDVGGKDGYIKRYCEDVILEEARGEELIQGFIGARKSGKSTMLRNVYNRCLQIKNDGNGFEGYDLLYLDCKEFGDMPLKNLFGINVKELKSYNDSMDVYSEIDLFAFVLYTCKISNNRWMLFMGILFG